MWDKIKMLLIVPTDKGTCVYLSLGVSVVSHSGQVCAGFPTLAQMTL